MRCGDFGSHSPEIGVGWHPGVPINKKSRGIIN